MAMECETTIKKEPDLFIPEEMVFEKTTVKLEPHLEMFSRNEIHDDENDATEQDYMVYKNESEGYKQETEEKYNVTEVKIPKEELIKSEDSIDIHYEFIKTEDEILEPGGHCEVCGKHFIILDNSKEFYPDCSCHEQNELINIGNEDVTKDVALSSTATTSDSSAASRRILQICLNTETKPIIVPEKSNIISEDSPACSSNAEDSPISSLTLKMNSENNSSCSRDSAEDPTHLPDSNFGKNETNRRRSENYKFRIADGDENAISGTTNERDELMNEAGFSEQHKTSRTKPFKVIRQPDFCFFCKTEVKNFARHIQRNHVGETEVQNILALPSNSIERKRAFACLRKKGNFIQNSTTFSKPVHRSPLKDTEENYIPCPYCLGFYSRKLLWKHKKMCSFNKNPLVGKSLSAGQNLLPCVDQTNLNLTTKVFPRMWADKVSLTAKKDSLICAFGSRYLNTHKELHRIHVCSRKMRELAKVLMESQKFDSSIKNLFDLLLPQYFDVVVQSVKVIAKYDPQKEEFESPTFAMNISRTLKDCCDIAILHIVKRKHNYLNLTASEAEAHVELFRKLLETTWKHKISIKAGNYLNKTSFNKITLVPLAADLKLFRDYLIKKGKEAAHNVKQNIKNSKAFKVLMETIFCRLLLSNRRRVGELQTMKLATYMSTEESNNSNYEEFADAVTPAEKLLKIFKRVVTRGKGGRGVPVLFSTDVQDHMKLFLQARSEFVDESNSFLFANPASKEQPLIGYKVLYKYTRLCGAVNPEALTSSKLRKHLATLNQVFNMTQNDIEQLATLMGHTVDAHKQVYRLPDDVYQTAKIAKLLMLMERGEAGNYEGKTLDEIDLKMDDEILEEEDEENYDLKNDLEIIEGINDSRNILDEDIEASQHNIRDSSSTVNKNADNFKKRLLVPWTNQQKKVVTQFFQNHINMKKPPRRHECDNLRDKYPKLLENKSWKKIKVFIQNSYKKKT